jgi:CRISPR/Cas system-associated exonuclease Cas4 (RecB family)
MRRLSQTSMSTYETCPQKWKLQYVDGRPTKTNRFMNLGSAVHAALECFYQQRVSEPATLDEMIQAFEAEIDPAAYESEEQRERARADGLQMIRDFRTAHAPGFRPALLVEGLISFELDGVPLVAKIDRVDKLNGQGNGQGSKAGRGAVRIVDYKSGFKAPQLEQVRKNAQLTLYQVAVESALGLKVKAVGLYHVPSQTLFEVPAHGPEQVDALRGRVLRVARGIELEEFEPRPGRRCEWCDFKAWCPAWVHEYPENWVQEPLPPAPTHEEAASLVERYGAIKDEIRALGGALEEVREPLERFFAATGERSAEGERYRVSGSLGRSRRFDHDELRRLLEPEGLWERVLAPDWHAEEALLEDPGLPAELRARLEQIADTEESWTLRYRRKEDPQRAPPGVAEADSGPNS